MKGLMACPYYQDEIGSKTFRTYGNICYIGINVSTIDHMFRRMKGSSNDSDEHSEAVNPPFGFEVYEQVKD